VYCRNPGFGLFLYIRNLVHFFSKKETNKNPCIGYNLIRKMSLGGAAMEPLFIDFLNSDYYDYRGTGRREERLESPEWVASFLGRWPWAHLEMPVDDTLSQLKSLRSLLRGAVEGFTRGEELTADLVAHLNACLADVTYVRRFEPQATGGALHLVPVNADWRWVMAEIVASFLQMVTEGHAGRVKICENPDCKWVYYDESKNRTRRWCSHDTCGTLMKVRRFRSRQKAGQK